MLITPPEVDIGKRSEAVFIIDRMCKGSDGWMREISYWFEGDEYLYGLQTLSARNEEDARRIMYGAKPNKELHAVFLRDVRLDKTRPH